MTPTGLAMIGIVAFLAIAIAANNRKKATDAKDENAQRNLK